MSEHIVSIKTYLVIFLALMVGTILTVIAGKQDFPGPLNVIIALTIACIKATLVILYFMHVRYSSRLIWVIVGAALFWLAILFVLTFSDYWSRDWLKASLNLPAPTTSYLARQPLAHNLGTPAGASNLQS